MKTGEFQDLGIVDAWGHQQKFADLINYVMRNPTAAKLRDKGLDTERVYYFDPNQRIMVVEWAKEKGSNAYGELSTCYRVTSPNPWDEYDSIPGEDLPVP